MGTFPNLSEITTIVIYIIPGFITLQTINICTDYLYEKSALDKIIHFLIFSFICYVVAGITLLLPYTLLLILVGNMAQYFVYVGDFFERNNFVLTVLAILYAVPIGFLLGFYYFKKGYPFKHFRQFTRKKYIPSIFAELETEYADKETFLTFHMNDGAVIIGEAVSCDRDERKRDYVFSIKNVEKYYPNTKTKVRLKGQFITINSRDASLIEFYGENPKK